MTTLLTTLETRCGWPVVLLAGVAMVILAVLGNGLAALTGVALVALGAGGTVANRVAPERRLDWLLLHTLVYGTLYATFLGARLHAGASGPLLLADLAGSWVAIMMLATLLRDRLSSLS